MNLLTYYKYLSLFVYEWYWQDLREHKEKLFQKSCFRSENGICKWKF